MSSTLFLITCNSKEYLYPRSPTRASYFSLRWPKPQLRPVCASKLGFTPDVRLTMFGDEPLDRTSRLAYLHTVGKRIYPSLFAYGYNVRFFLQTGNSAQRFSAAGCAAWKLWVYPIGSLAVHALCAAAANAPRPTLARGRAPKTCASLNCPRSPSATSCRCGTGSAGKRRSISNCRLSGSVFSFILRLPSGIHPVNIPQRRSGRPIQSRRCSLRSSIPSCNCCKYDRWVLIFLNFWCCQYAKIEKKLLLMH